MLIKIYSENPDEKRIQQVIDVLKKGGVIVYPTDSVYSMGCDMANKRAVEKMAQLKGVKLEEANFSLICYDLSNISEYTVQFGTDIYKMMKRALPGPYTFILNANKNIPIPNFTLALGLYLLSHHFEKKGASVIIKKEFNIPNHDAGASVVSLLNSLSIFQVTMSHSPKNAIPNMMFE